MKYDYIWGILLALVLGVAGCINDKGNYDYLSEEDVIPGMISGLEESFTVQFGTTEKLEVKVEGVEGKDNLRYMWYIYKIPNNSPRDTLGYGTSIDWYVDSESGSYHLWFEVRDTLTDVCVNQMAKVTVETALSNAWLIVESENGNTDVDAIAEDGVVMEDVITQATGGRLKGDGVKIVYTNEHSCEVENPDGSTDIKKVKAFYVLSKEEIKVFNAENMEILKNTEDCFYETPQVIDIANCSCKTFDVYLINDGKYYSLSGSSSNVGKFSFAKTGPSDASYSLHVDNLYAGYNATMVFDQLSRSFLWASSSAALSTFSEATAGNVDFGSLSNMDVDLCHLLPRSSIYDWNTYTSSYTAYAIMKNDAGRSFLMDIAYAGKSTYPVKDYKELPKGCRLGNADVAVAHKTAAAIYFVDGSDLWVHEVNGKMTVGERERLLLPFDGEEVVYLRHTKSAITSTFSMDALVVLTNSGESWKLYAFPFIGGGSEIDTDVDLDNCLIASGKGRAMYCMRLNNGVEY